MWLGENVAPTLPKRAFFYSRAANSYMSQKKWLSFIFKSIQNTEVE